MFNSYSDTFSIFGFEIAAYSIFVILGFFTAFMICNRRWKKRGYNSEELDSFFFYAIIIAIFGARVWYAIANPGRIRIGIGLDSDLLISPNMQGLAIQGGVIAVTVFAYFFFNKPNRSVTFIQAADAIVPAILIGHMIGRWGNFFNQEVYGAVVDAGDLWWVPSFIAKNMLIDEYYRIPLFLIEGTINVIGFILIVFVLERLFKKALGLSFASYFIFYGILRFILEQFRDEQDIMYWGSIRSSLVMSVVFIIIGIYVIWTITIPSLKENKAKNTEEYEFDI